MVLAEKKCTRPSDAKDNLGAVLGRQEVARMPQDAPGRHKASKHLKTTSDVYLLALSLPISYNRGPQVNPTPTPHDF